MDAVRRFTRFSRSSLLITAASLGTIALIVGLLGWASERPTVSANAANALANANAYFDSTIVLARNSRPRGTRGDELAVSLGYLERLRLGVGSPFRLVDEALNDPRLDADMQHRVAWALLARLRRGQAYVIDPAVLDGAGPWLPDGHGATGAAHLALIEHAIRSASDPRAGELAVRLAYLIESAKASLSPSAVTVATQVAAMIRDRESADADLRDLLADANESHADVLELLASRRADHAFRVEQPTLAPLDSRLQREAMDAVPALVAALDTLDRVANMPANPSDTASLLGPAFAARLATLAARQPPVAQVVVTLRTQPHAGFSATNGESLVANYAPVAALADSTRRASALALLATTVSVRTLAQDAPWFPGDGGPAPADLTAEFGLASVSFTRAVPAAWQPYYLGELQTALRDIQLVYPTFVPSGLHVHIGAEVLPDSALAMHDPRTRTMQLAVTTSGGTLAHELSHDMDFQASKRLFAAAGGYSTDRSVTEPRGVLAQSVRGLAEARLIRPAAAGTAPSTDRPAELFARGSDWFVATSLAQRGVMNGFLSAIQDELLTGYAAGAPTAVGSAGAQSLTSAIDAMTFLPDTLRAAFESQWSDPRVVDPVLLVRRVVDTPVSWRSTRSGTLPFDHAAELCTADPSANGRARERLLMLAVDARAEGIAKRRAKFHIGDQRPDWANSLLGRAPWSPDAGRQMVRHLRVAIADQLTTTFTDQGVLPVVPSIFRASAASCSRIAD